MSRFIVTTAPKLQKAALAELKRADGNLVKSTDFKNGVFLAEAQMGASKFNERLIRIDLIFVKHIMPVQEKIHLSGRKSSDLPSILESLSPVCTIHTEERFCVQCRRIGTEHDYNSKDVEVFVGNYYKDKGSVPVFDDTEAQTNNGKKVIGIYLFNEEGYLGLTTVRKSLNGHCDEYRIFSRQGKQISRAEAKLREALRKFTLTIPCGRALDLGAAPGGWTNVLADAGMKVTSVDPAELDIRVTSLPSVTHVKAKAEEYTMGGQFDLLLNDMNRSPRTSATIMVRLATHLKPGAFALMTAKLVSRDPERLIGEMVPILKRAYHVLSIKSLFHNRREATVLMQRPDSPERVHATR